MTFPKDHSTEISTAVSSSTESSSSSSTTTSKPIRPQISLFSALFHQSNAKNNSGINQINPSLSSDISNGLLLLSSKRSFKARANNHDTKPHQSFFFSGNNRNNTGASLCQPQTDVKSDNVAKGRSTSLNTPQTTHASTSSSVITATMVNRPLLKKRRSLLSHFGRKSHNADSAVSLPEKSRGVSSNRDDKAPPARESSRSSLNTIGSSTSGSSGNGRIPPPPSKAAPPPPIITNLNVLTSLPSQPSASSHKPAPKVKHPPRPAHTLSAVTAGSSPLDTVLTPTSPTDSSCYVTPATSMTTSPEKQLFDKIQSSHETHSQPKPVAEKGISASSSISSASSGSTGVADEERDKRHAQLVMIMNGKMKLNKDFEEKYILGELLGDGAFGFVLTAVRRSDTKEVWET